LKEKEFRTRSGLLGMATCIQTSSTRRTARILSEIHPVSHTAVWKWIKKLEEELPISTEKKQRNLIALDETIVKANKKRYCREERVNSHENLHNKKLPDSEIFCEMESVL